jgi:hypothetical protein
MNQDYNVDSLYGFRKQRHFVLFNLKGVADVEVRLLQPQSNEAIYPSRYNIETTRTADPSGDLIAFTINRPRYHVLTFENEYDGLVFFIDPVVDNPPQLGDPNVKSILDYGFPNDGTGDTANNQALFEQAMEEVGNSDTLDTLYFPPGYYRTQAVYLHEDVALYFAPGSRLHLSGDWKTVGNTGHWSGGIATSFRNRSQILGRGVFTFPYKYGTLALDRSQNNVMEGVLVLDGTPGTKVFYRVVGN